MCICGSMVGHSHAPYPSKSATQDWQRRDNPLVKSESRAETNWRTGEHGDALFCNKHHKFAGKSPFPIPDIAPALTHKLHRQDSADRAPPPPSSPPPLFRRPGPGRPAPRAPSRSRRVGSVRPGRTGWLRRGRRRRRRRSRSSDGQHQ
jgi:hypothetical protein